MHEVYTCICGGQIWQILGAKIECDKCGKEYEMMWEDDPMENPEDFNERIRQEEHGGLVAEPEPLFIKKLIDDKEA